MGAAQRHALLQRLHRSTTRRDVVLVAFGLGDQEVRCLFRGPLAACEQTIRAVKIGTTRAIRSQHATFEGCGHSLDRVGARELTEATAWCHTPMPVIDPLAWRWSSHRDLLGYRQASFYDPTELQGRVSPRRVHQLAGGGPLPRRNSRAHQGVGLHKLLQASAAVLGRLPADPKTFGIFVQLAKELGYATAELAKALNLSTRRIRQLAAHPHPLTRTAALYLVDERLAA